MEASSGHEGNGGTASLGPHIPDDGAPSARAPPCVINWSERIDHAEAELRRAMIITVIGDHKPVSIEEVMEAITSQFNINTTPLSLCCSGVAC